MSADERDGSHAHATESDTAVPPQRPWAAGGAFRTEPGDDATDPQASGSASRRARLRVSRVNLWSVTKLGFVVSLVCFIVLFVAVAVLYGILSLLGVFEAVNSAVSIVAGGDVDWFTAPRVLGYTAFLGSINVVLVTLLAAVGAVIYNLAADLVGGIEVTLTEGE